MVHLSTGDMLRAEIKQGSLVGREAEQYMSRGLLLPDALMVRLVAARLRAPDIAERGVLLDGFPRTKAQAEALAATFAADGVRFNGVVEIDVPDEVLLKRLTGRRLDPATGEIYHLDHRPPPTPEIAARVIQRADDKPDVQRARLQQYRATAAAVVAVFNKAGAPVEVVDGDGSIDATYGRFVTAMGRSMGRLRSFKGQSRL
jgi:adenylate kinase